jgi:hypothetical protein
LSQQSQVLVQLAQGVLMNHLFHINRAVSVHPTVTQDSMATNNQVDVRPVLEDVNHVAQ